MEHAVVAAAVMLMMMMMTVMDDIRIKSFRSLEPLLLMLMMMTSVMDQIRIKSLDVCSNDKESTVQSLEDRRNDTELIL